MTSMPWIDWVLSSLESTSSAGGQLEQPSEVNSSTSTGVALGPAALVSLSGETVAADSRCWFNILNVTTPVTIKNSAIDIFIFAVLIVVFGTVRLGPTVLQYLNDQRQVSREPAVGRGETRMKRVLQEKRFRL